VLDDGEAWLLESCNAAEDDNSAEVPEDDPPTDDRPAEEEDHAPDADEEETASRDEDAWELVAAPPDVDDRVPPVELDEEELEPAGCPMHAARLTRANNENVGAR
jgi:hypothetical protein